MERITNSLWSFDFKKVTPVIQYLGLHFIVIWTAEHLIMNQVKKPVYYLFDFATVSMKLLVTCHIWFGLWLNICSHFAEKNIGIYIVYRYSAKIYRDMTFGPYRPALTSTRFSYPTKIKRQSHVGVQRWYDVELTSGACWVVG